MFYIIVLCLMSLCLTSCCADISVADYIYWKKADIDAWDEYFPSMDLETEGLTIMGVSAAVESMANNLNGSLYEIVGFPITETGTAEILMQGSDAEGCLKGIIDYLPIAIAEEISTYNDCSADATSNLARFTKSLNTVRNNYLTAYQRALSGIDVCARTYPNKDSIERLKSCVNFMYTNYFTAAKVVENYLTPSPTMTYYQDVCIGCASNAYTATISKGKNFLRMLLNCALLDPNIDQTSYAEQLSQWKIYNDTLASQILECQAKSDKTVLLLRTEIVRYYNLRKEAMEKYVIESRDVTFYEKSMYLYLDKYYNTVTAASLDNPGDSSCTVAAISALNNIVNANAEKSLTCDKEIVADTLRLMSQVNDTFSSLNKEMLFIRDPAIVSCISLGDVFAPNTVSDSCNLIDSQFELDYLDAHALVDQNVNTLTRYKSFFSGSDQPCGGTSLKRAFLAADITLYKLQRCLYSSSGIAYFVTTPSTTTLSTNTAQTTTAQATTDSTTVLVTTNQPITLSVATDKPTTSEVTTDPVITSQPSTGSAISTDATTSVTTDQVTRVSETQALDSTAPH